MTTRYPTIPSADLADYAADLAWEMQVLCQLAGMTPLSALFHAAYEEARRNRDAAAPDAARAQRGVRKAAAEDAA